MSVSRDLDHRVANDQNSLAYHIRDNIEITNLFVAMNYSVRGLLRPGSGQSLRTIGC